ncbi:uncharacterized protein JCM6883_006067 [Sporobolomyces salmoneus]|uniref:uncharacterized protein n=1 Tax=Sporobolomyces salmoneus TaxID=183962 RepID=UPI00317B3650
MLAQQRPEKTGRKVSTSRSKYASRSCNPCRRRKAKCDGIQPACSTCTLYNDECTWSTETDKRRIAKKGEVAALRERIKVLEGLLEGTTRDNAQGQVERRDERTELVDSDENEEDSDTEKEVTSGAGVNRLKLDEETLQFTNYGPTSAFQHLPEPSASRLSASPLAANDFSPSPIPSTVLSDSADDGGPIHWNKYLPALDSWDKELHDELLELFFAHFNNWCMWLEEDSFRRDLRSVLALDSTHSTSRTSHYSPLLHLVVLAIACPYSDDARASRTASQQLVTTAKSHLDEEGERPTIATVRGLLLMGSWHSGNGLQGLGNLYSGIGFRMCMTLGLGIDCRSFVRRGVLSESLQRTRDYTMWTAYIQDKLWSSYVGRNPTLLLSVLDTPAPFVDEEIDSRLWKPLAGSQRRSPALSNLTSCFRWLTTLSVLQERVLTILYSLRTNVKSPITLNLVSDLNLKLESWMSKLPASLRIPPQLTKPPPSHVIMLNALYHFVIILLYRPYYNNTDQLPIHEIAVKRCNAASSRIISLFELYEVSPGLRRAPVSLVQIAFAAGTTQLLACVNSNGKKAQDAKESAMRCVAGLKEIGNAWRCGTQTAGILERLVNEWAPETSPTPIQNDASSSVAETPEVPNPQLAPDLVQTLVSMGWVPPTQPPPATSSTSFPPPEAQPLLASPPMNPLSLQNGFASAFSQPFPQYPYTHPQQFPAFYPPPDHQYDPNQMPWLPSTATSTSTSEPLPDDVFAAMLSYAGRDAMLNGDMNLGGSSQNSDWQF